MSSSWPVICPCDPLAGRSNCIPAGGRCCSGQWRISWHWPAPAPHCTPASHVSAQREHGSPSNVVRSGAQRPHTAPQWPARSIDCPAGASAPLGDLRARRTDPWPGSTGRPPCCAAFWILDSKILPAELPESDLQSTRHEGLQSSERNCSKAQSIQAFRLAMLMTVKWEAPRIPD